MTQKLSTSQIWLRGGVSAAIAAVLNLAVAVVSASLVSASPEFLALQPGPVLSVTVFTVLVGTLVYAVLSRFTARPTLVFAVVAAVVALGSLVAPISLAFDASGAIAGTTPAAALALIPLHLIPAGVLVTALSWRRKAVAA